MIGRFDNFGESKKLYDAEVILGDIRKKCSGHGICKVVVLGSSVDQCYCKDRLQAKIEVSERSITVILLRKALTPGIYHTHLGGGVVCLPSDIPVIGMAEQTVIKAGCYVVSPRAGAFVINFCRSFCTNELSAPPILNIKNTRTNRTADPVYPGVSS